MQRSSNPASGGEEKIGTTQAEVAGPWGPGPCSVKMQLPPWESEGGLELKVFSMVSRAAWTRGRSPCEMYFQAYTRSCPSEQRGSASVQRQS